MPDVGIASGPVGRGSDPRAGVRLLGAGGPGQRIDRADAVLAVAPEVDRHAVAGLQVLGNSQFGFQRPDRQVFQHEDVCNAVLGKDETLGLVGGGGKNAQGVKGAGKKKTHVDV